MEQYYVRGRSIYQDMSDARNTLSEDDLVFINNRKFTPNNTTPKRIVNMLKRSDTNILIYVYAVTVEISY